MTPWAGLLSSCSSQRAAWTRWKRAQNYDQSAHCQSDITGTRRPTNQL